MQGVRKAGLRSLRALPCCSSPAGKPPPNSHLILYGVYLNCNSALPVAKKWELEVHAQKYTFTLERASRANAQRVLISMYGCAAADGSAAVRAPRHQQCHVGVRDAAAPPGQHAHGRCSRHRRAYNAPFQAAGDRQHSLVRRTQQLVFPNSYHA